MCYLKHIADETLGKLKFCENKIIFRLNFCNFYYLNFLSKIQPLKMINKILKLLKIAFLVKKVKAYKSMFIKQEIKN